MAKGNAPLLAFNRGIVSKKALSRTDVDRMRLSAEVMENWLPKTAGSMFLRPGFGYIASSRNDAMAVDIPFVASTDDTALIELADGKMRVRVNDALVSRPAVTTAITTPNFSSGTGWTEANTGGGDCTFGGSGLVLNAVNLGGLALCKQQVTCSGGNVGVRHALNINVSRGPVTFRCGSSDGGDEYISETVLRTGMHSLAFTPTGNFWVQFQSDADVSRLVASCAVASSGTMELDIPWASADLSKVRWDQSADVVFIACEGHQQRLIERRATDSWSLVRYAPNNGPFFSTRSAKVKLRIGQVYGNTTLTADKAFFKPSHVRALFRSFGRGIDGVWRLAGEGQATRAFRVRGVGGHNEANGDRSWRFSVAGTWAGSLRWQRSFEESDSGFTNFRPRNDEDNHNAAITSNESSASSDGDDNAIIYYRLGFKLGDYTSGVAVATVQYDGDSHYGVARVLAVNSPTEAVVEVLSRFANTDPSEDWQEGIWSDKQGWPSDVSFHKGRLFWLGRSRFIGSVSDDYENFDPDFEGDAGPINRTLGSGPVDTVNFALSLTRLLIGTAGSEFSIKSTSIDEPLTPQNAQAGDPSTQGSRKGVNAVKVDDRGVFAQRSGKRLFELLFDTNSYEYKPRDLTLLAPDLTGPAKVVGMAVQRQPDTRIHVWLSDGTVCILTYEPSEEVACWSRISVGGGGFVERAVVLPGEDEDQVYYRVRFTINGATKRYLMKMALESECVGGTMNKQADAFIVRPSITGTSVTGLSHLEGRQVVAWGGGAYLGTYTVSSGSITLSASVTAMDVLVGLSYEARYKSAKLAYAAVAGTALAQKKKVNKLALILGPTHNDGLYFGRDFTNMDPLPRRVNGRPVEADEILDDFELTGTAFPGEWNTDSRLCLKAVAPKPCEVQAAIVSVETHESV